MSGLQARLGLLTDVQYADKDDREWEGSVFRFREARHVLERAVDDLNAKEDLKVVLHLGDIIDGHWDPAMPLEERKRRSLADLEVSAALFDRIRHPKVFVFGNHCLQAPREAVMTRLGMERCYFSQQLCPGWRLIVLDSTALSHPLMEPFRTHDVEDGEWKEWWDAHEGEVHRQPYNGGVGRAQLVWLKEELSQAEAHRDRVLVTIHHPVMDGQSRSMHRAWDGEAVASTLLASPAFAVLLCGHDHLGGYACMDGRHFVTVEGALEAPVGAPCHGVVELYADRIVIRGQGSMRSHELPLRAW